MKNGSGYQFFLPGMMGMTQKINSIYHSLELLSCCGSGAYGDVFLCRDLSGRELAVKIVSKKKLGADWERELRGVINYRRITEDAPGLLKLHSVGEDEETFYYTMDAADSSDPATYVPDTLAARLKNGPLPDHEIEPVLSELFAGIRTIHLAGLVHRDIKPENILFVKGKPKIGDIGLLANLSATMTCAAGTLDYLPPEERIPTDSDPASGKMSAGNDWYAFGKVIYCAITGQSVCQWPALPEGLPFTPQLKFFLRLSFRLCDRIPARRLASAEEIEREMTEIRRKLDLGENGRDRLLFLLKSAKLSLQGMLFETAAFVRKYWWILLILVLAAGTTIWYFRPAPAFDISREKTREYFNETQKFTLRIPWGWEVLKSSDLKKLLNNARNPAEPADSIKNQRIAFVLEILNQGSDCIFLNFDNSDFVDNITIQTLRIPSSEVLNVSDGELRLGIQRLHAGNLGFRTEIYAFKRMTFKGYPCIFLDLSHEPDRYRSHNYMLVLKDCCISIALSAKLSTFGKVLPQFEAVLQTLEFQK